MTSHPISTTYLDQQTARASAALAGAGAWDAAPLELYCPGFKQVMIYFRYTRGGAAGAFDIKVELSRASTGTVWHQASNYSPALAALGVDTQSADQREFVRYGATGAAEERGAFGPLELGGTVERIRIPAKEGGNVGAPGTLELLVNFS